jgi:lipopolysaccharide/colanic/teichoic acid biosynthesis glycosyltransferase
MNERSPGEVRTPRFYAVTKRALDLGLSLLALPIVLPVGLLCVLAIRLESPGPVLFAQQRTGQHGVRFPMFKFRTMVQNAEELKASLQHLNILPPPDFKIPNDPRITRAGGWLRRFSMDELPQLVNVVKGDMSLVGPRPLILEEDQHVLDWRRNRLNLKPGITGLWQVLGRDDIPFEEMVRLDYVYVTTWSLLNDLKLILRTLPAVFRTRTSY